MSSNPSALWLAPLAAAFALQVAAQPASTLPGAVPRAAASAATPVERPSTAGAPTAALASAPVPGRSVSAPFHSAFEGYVPFTDEKVLPWKDTNATVGQVGGGRVYAKEANAPDAADGKGTVPAAPKATTAPAALGKQ